MKGKTSRKRREKHEELMSHLNNARDMRNLEIGDRAWGAVQFTYTIFFGLGCFGAGIIATLFVIGVIFA